MFGIAPRHVRSLCDNSWEGGNQYTPAQVGDMTLDMLFMMLIDKKLLRIKGRQRVSQTPAYGVATDKKGLAKGRAADGTPIRARIGGKSLAQQIREKAALEQKETGRERRARQRKERAERRAKKGRK